MEKLLISIVLLIIVVLPFVASGFFRDRFCKNCGTIMHIHYDPEEDDNIWQCPKCGRSYLIK